jgi:hypothetical protein
VGAALQLLLFSLLQPFLWLLIAAAITALGLFFLRTIPNDLVSPKLKSIFSLLLVFVVLFFPYWEDKLLANQFSRFCSKTPLVSEEYTGLPIEGVELLGHISLDDYGWARRFSYAEFRPEEVPDGETALRSLPGNIYRMKVSDTFTEGCAQFVALAVLQETSNIRRHAPNTYARRSVINQRTERYERRFIDELKEFLGGGCIEIEKVETLKSNFFLMNEWKEKHFGRVVFRPVFARQILLRSKNPPHEEYFIRNFSVKRGAIGFFQSVIVGFDYRYSCDPTTHILTVSDLPLMFKGD